VKVLGKYITVIYLPDCHRTSVAANKGKQSQRSNMIMMTR